VLVSGVVQAGERALRRPPQHVILTYDLAGTLRRKWVTNPWHVHEMAVDCAGNVYALGDRIDAHSANLVRKYTRDGVLEWFGGAELTTSFFPMLGRIGRDISS
jgi:hypothetical protein